MRYTRPISAALAAITLGASVTVFADGPEMPEGSEIVISEPSEPEDNGAEIAVDFGGKEMLIKEAVFPFTDVAEDDWFYSDVKSAWESGLINGTSEYLFSPDGNLTYAEAVKLAACMNQLYLTGEVTLVSGYGGEWYAPYADFCRNNGIISGDLEWSRAATRAGYMEIFASALPASALAEINTIIDGAISDISDVTVNQSAAIYRLYRAGIVQGTGDDHACAPDAYIRRGEVAAILTRMMNPEARLRFDMTELQISEPDPEPEPEHVIETVDGVTYVDGILIANKTYSLPSTYAPGGLTAECETAFAALRKGAAAAGLNIYLVSGYRSYEYQQGLYARYVARDGQAAADRYSARAGHSEHQTGLAIDVNSVQFSFADTAEGKWLAAHCAEYGFILRYPKGKEDITGYMYEPWHIRYLGVDIAKKVTESGLTLEEYLGITSRYGG